MLVLVPGEQELGRSVRLPDGLCGLGRRVRADHDLQRVRVAQEVDIDGRRRRQRGEQSVRVEHRDGTLGEFPVLVVQYPTAGGQVVPVRVVPHQSELLQVPEAAVDRRARDVQSVHQLPLLRGLLREGGEELDPLESGREHVAAVLFHAGYCWYSNLFIVFSPVG